MILDINNLTFTYNSRLVLADVRFSVNKGELMVILGPNGVGKTTLLKCINAIHCPSDGSILLEGRDILRMSPGEIALAMGYVAQKSDTAQLTVYDAVLMGRKPHIRWKVGEADLMMVEATLRLLDLTHLALRQIDKLSGGELQKVAVARALVQETQLLLFDEPTSSLDLKNQISILRMIRGVVDEHRIAAIITMHDLNTALRFADTFIFLKDGGVYAAGRCEEITAVIVQEVYGLPVEIHYFNGYPLVVPIDEKETCPANSYQVI